MATIELNDDTLYTSALPAGSRLFGATSAAATEPTSFGREAIYNYVSAALSPVAASGSATDLTSGTLPLGRLHAWLADIASIAAPNTNDVLYFNGTDFVSGPATTIAVGGLAAANNLSDVASAATARTNLGLAIGTNVQAWDAQLDSLSSASANGVSLVTAADYAAMRALLDLEAGTDFLSPAAIAAAYQQIDSDLTSWAGVTRASGFDAFAATPSSANLASLVTDETGSGALVFGTSPTLTTPNIGAASGTSLSLSSGTGLTVGSSIPFSDSAGTLTLQNIDALDATSRSTIETALQFTQAGTGAAARTIVTKLREQIHVKDYGAIGDGSTDDTASLQAAITYAISVGGEVLLGQGKYRITGATGLLIDESATTADDDATRISIVGEGSGASQIVHNGTGSAITYQGGSTSSGPHSYLRLDGFRIDGTNGTGQHGISIDNAAYFSMEDVTIYECDTALALTDVLSFQVSSSVFRYNKRGVTASYVSFSRPNNVTFEDCVFGTNSTAAAVIEGAGLVRFRGGSVEVCGTNATSGTGGIFIINSGVESGVGLVCEDVYFENNLGDCDISFDETSQSVLHVLRGCTFQQFQSPHVTNNVLMACSSGVGLHVAVEGCNFSNIGGYTGTFAAFNTAGAAGAAWSLNIEPDTRFDAYITRPTASARIMYGLRAPSVTDHGVALFTATPGLTASTGAGTSGQVLTSNGSSADPTFQAVGQIFKGTTGLIGTPLAAGSTTYIGLGPQSQSATEFHVYFVIPKAGTIRNMYVYTDGAPGVGQTYTFTLRVGLADTSVVATISGNASNSASDTTHTAAVAAGDRVSIKVVTSGTAATISNALWAFTFEVP